MSGDANGINADFLGGPTALFEAAGREQLIVLLEHGLAFDSYLLDIGCGALRGGRWVIPLLEQGHYCGIEPARAMLERGLRDFISPEMVALKRPRFDSNDRFDFSVFGIRFTHFMARSIWTHASKEQITAMLDGVVACGANGAVLLTSFIPAEDSGRADYDGSRWVGRSHESSEPGTVAHSWSWVVEACGSRGLVPERVDRPPLQRGGQVWCSVTRG